MVVKVDPVFLLADKPEAIYIIGLHTSGAGPHQRLAQGSVGVYYVIVLAAVFFTLIRLFSASYR